MRTRLALVLIMAVAVTACETVDEQPTSLIGQAALSSASGQPAGQVRLLANGDETNLSITVTGLPPGPHGVHLHTTGACTAPTFDSAGAHLNPSGRQHGTENPAGPHLGDLPNLTVGPGGAGTVSATLPGTRAAVLAQLFDADGTAVVVHAAADDYRTQPSGASGARIACGVLSAA